MNLNNLFRFQGTSPEPRKGLPSGHMPFSISLPFTQVVNSDTKTLLPLNMLWTTIQSTFLESPLVKSRMNVTKSDENINMTLSFNEQDKIVCTCGSGITASVLFFALQVLREQGYPISSDISVYDGSWTEYASQPSSQIITS